MKWTFLFTFLGIQAITFGQSIDEGLLFSLRDINGSPRYVALGGAMGALGNDFSGIHDNPAGLSVFRRDRVEFDLAYQNITIDSEFYGTRTTESNGGFMVAQAGLVKEIKDWRYLENRFHFGVSFRRLAHFDQDFRISGQNPQSSIIDQWIFNSNGTSPSDLIADGWLYEGMAWEGFLTDVADSSNWAYTSFATGLDLNQDRQVTRTGGHDELMLSMSGGYDHKFFYGAGIGIPFLSFNEQSIYSERGFDENSTVDDFTLIDIYELDAIGLNLHLGVQYRFNYWWRVGASWISPTIYWANASFDTQLSTNFSDGTFIGPIAYFNDDIGYRLSSPQRFMASSAFVYGKQGLISIQYETVHQTRQRFTSDDLDLDFLDEQASEQLKWQHFITASTEYRIKTVSLRGFYRLGSSSFAANDEGITAEQAFGLGVGVILSKWRLDLAWRSQRRSGQHFLYNEAFTAPAQQDFSNSLFSFGAHFNL